MVSQKPWRLEPLMRLLAFLLISFSVGAIVAEALRHSLGNQVVERNMLPLILSMLCLHGAGFVAILLFVRAHQITWAEAFGFKNETGWAVLLGLCVAIVVLPVCWWLQSEMANLLSRWGFEVGEQEAVRLLRMADALWKQVLLGVFAIVVAPVVEELFFRGIAYPMVKQRGHPWLALWGTAGLFALVHGTLVILVPLTFLAVVMTLLYEWTDNLLACMVVHSLFNAANFVMLFVLKHAGELPAN